MGELLKGGTLVDLAEPIVERANLRVDAGTIVARGADLSAQPGDRITDLSGKLVLGGLVAGHTHLYAALARGLPAPVPAPKSLLELLERETWKLDRAHDLESVEISAQVGATEALRCGVTTLFDHHSSPSAVEGSLSAVRRGIDRVGLRAMLCCEVTDRHGRPTRVAALRETEAFLASARSGRVRAAVGGHASFTLETETLQAMSQLATAYGAGVHLHAAESPDDESETRKRFEKGIVQRLLEAGLLGPRMILAHCIHFAWEDFSALHTSGAWLVHCARSDMRRNTGYAPAGKFGPRKALGTDGLGGDILAEGQACYLRGHEAGFPIDLTRWHSAGQQMATELFGQPMGALKPGAVADLVVLDYPVATELSAQTLPGHLGLGIGAAHVDAAMIDGIWRLWAREVLSFDEPELRSRARPAAQRLWSRMSEL